MWRWRDGSVRWKANLGWRTREFNGVGRCGKEVCSVNLEWFLSAYTHLPKLIRQRAHIRLRLPVSHRRLLTVCLLRIDIVWLRLLAIVRRCTSGLLLRSELVLRSKTWRKKLSASCWSLELTTWSTSKGRRGAESIARAIVCLRLSSGVLTSLGMATMSLWRR